LITRNQTKNDRLLTPNAFILRPITVLRSESPRGMCSKLRTVAASNNRVHPSRSLSSPPLASTINCSPGSQALLEITHQDHTPRSLYAYTSHFVQSFTC